MTSINRKSATADKTITASLTTYSNSDSVYVANYVTVKSNNVEFDDFVFDVNSRYMTTITKDRLFNASSVLDIVPEDANWSDIPFETVVIGVLKGNDEIREMGNTKELNDAQIKLLKSTNYSTDFYIKARGRNLHTEAGMMEDYVYYVSIVPEKETEYISGYEAFITYLKENSKDHLKNIEKNLLHPGKIEFTITKEGTIEDIELISSSGYLNVDSKMMELIKNTPGKWNPAENSKGEKVIQKLVFSFGIMGC